MMGKISLTGLFMDVNLDMDMNNWVSIRDSEFDLYCYICICVSPEDGKGPSVCSVFWAGVCAMSSGPECVL